MIEFKNFMLKLLGFKKPSVYQMLIRRLEIFYEKTRRLDFLSVRPEEQLGLDKSLVSKASLSGNKYLFYLLKNMKISDNILDVGCANGSALKYFTKFTFKKIHGFELLKTLVEICRKNFTILNINNIKIYDQIAIDFKNYNEYNFFYLYNPFPEIIMIKFIDCLKKQIKNKKITIIYNNPVCHNVLINNEFLLVKKHPDMWGNGINVYTNVVKSNNNFE
ncbi:class I SAM-dependent methyltransferase [Flavobacteriaceae bacterium]|nr:class I SAM-dependent methyltransferase [Flavobacteriaceae bacterium]